MVQNNSKSLLRASLKQKRSLISEEDALNASKQILGHFQEKFFFSPTDVIAVYIPILHEVNIDLVIDFFRKKGHKLALPRVDTETNILAFQEWQEKASLYKGNFGISILKEDVPYLYPQIYLIPLLGFDRLGYRLGYGQGHYDRFLEKERSYRDIVAIGISYACQEVESVFPEIHDQKLDFVVTEKEVISFK